jgi:N-terminal domain of NWD NACHT-NTPase
MAGRKGLRDRLRDKLKISSSSKASEGPTANVVQTQPHLVHASQTTSGSERSSTTDGTEPTNHIASSEESVPTCADTSTATERHDAPSFSPPNPTAGTANRVPQAKNQATRTQDGLVQSAIETHEQTDIQHVDLWDRAYEMLRSRDKSLLEKYEKILDNELRASISSKAVFGAVTSVGMSVGLKGGGSIPNVTNAATTLAALGTPARQEQMKSLVQQKIKKYEDSAWKFKIGSTSIVVRDQTERFVNAIMFAKSFVDSVVASDPHVALAWTGVCILLPVSISFLN